MGSYRKSAGALQIWQARCYEDSFVEGLIISEAGNLDRLVLMILTPNSGDDEELGLPYALRLIETPSDTEGMELEVLRFAGLVKIPAFIFGLNCRPISVNGVVRRVAPIQPRPFCADMFAAMLSRGALLAMAR